MTSSWMRRETFNFGDLVRLILEILRCALITKFGYYDKYLYLCKPDTRHAPTVVLVKSRYISMFIADILISINSKYT